MRIHIVASKNFVNKNPGTAKQIIRSIQISAVPTTDWIKSAIAARTTIKHSNPKAVYTYEIKNIKECDGVVAEVSNGSLGVGYQVANAISNKKPVLCLFDVAIDKSRISTLISGSTDRNVYLIAYSPKDIEGLQKIIGDFIQQIRDRNLVKFNFITTNEIKRYILRESQKLGVSQSEFLRGVMEKILNEDLRYNKNI